MAELMKLLKARQENSRMSVESYANAMGLTAGALYNYINGKRETISLEAIRKMAKFYGSQSDKEMLAALASYALGVDSVETVSS